MVKGFLSKNDLMAKEANKCEHGTKLSGKGYSSKNATVHIGSKCPRTLGTAPNLLILSLVPKGTYCLSLKWRTYHQNFVHTAALNVNWCGKCAFAVQLCTDSHMMQACHA